MFEYTLEAWYNIEKEVIRLKMTETNWESLDISNDFLFGKVMQNPDLCKELLQRILPDLNIERIEYPELQKSIKEGAESRGIRLDVYSKDDKNIVYKCYGRELDKKTDKLPAGAEVTVEITGKGNYEGTKTTASYRILAANKDVSKASVRVNTKQYYSGRSVILAKNELTVKIGKTILSADDYEILPDTYVNNHKKGTAKVTIRGKGAYGGTKTISFRIYAQRLKK